MRLQFLTLIVAAIVSGASGCTPPGEMGESPQNRTLIMDVVDWDSRALSGEFSDPIYPVSLTQSGQMINFMTEASWTQGSVPGFSQEAFVGRLEIRNGRGTHLGHFDGVFAVDFAHEPDKLVWHETGSYPAGTDGTTSMDSALVDVTFTCCVTNSKGLALLPWKFASDASAINGTAATEVGSQVWVQAVGSGLVEPVSYSWQLNGALLPAVTGTFYSTTFSTPGGRDFTVTMTGANGAVDVKNWSLFVTCVGGALEC